METQGLFEKRVDQNQTSLLQDSTDKLRVIQIPKSPHQSPFTSNKITTSRYSPVTWIPKSLMMQFARVNNIYFLIMSILSFMSFSPKNPFSLAGTFAAVLIFTILKEGYEDLARHKQDTEINKKQYKKYSIEINEFVPVECQHIQVGDILQIKENESFPADLLIIGTSNPKGIAYVNTMNLDGETNLKEKVLSFGMIGNCKMPILKELGFELLTDQPNMSLVRWNCNIKRGGFMEPMNLKQLLLRGCVLKNTKWIYGVVVYTGNDSKIVMNSKKARTKSSNIQKTMNRILVSVFVFQIIICLILAILGRQWQMENDSVLYMDLPNNSDATFFLRMLTFWVAYSNLIPISLYVALEIARLILSNFIKNDLKMYDSSADRTATCKASDLIEELGQVEFIFSDKTGTLTCNEMVFRMCSISGKTFGEVDKPISADTSLKELIKLNPSGVPNEFCLVLALCNSVFPTKNESDIQYQASSPDELALVEAAKDLGYTLKEKIEDKVYFDINSQEFVWEIIAEIPFDSVRKRMSVVLRDTTKNVIKIFTKGADSTMLGLLNHPDSIQTVKTLHDFAVNGLRTLVLASREINEKEFTKWLAGWKAIQLSSDENKEELLNEHGNLLETQLDLIGITAIEDKLQENVPNTIEKLMKANIRIWVLTGDKEETAIEIAKSCNLIQPDMEVIEMFFESSSESKTKLERICKNLDFSQNSTFEHLNKKRQYLSKPLALVVNGLTLSYLLQDNTLKSLFFRLGYLSKSCICSRVSPSQKMEVVKLSAIYGKWISLAIGDGANDVSMIQQAHIGVGIAGKEGTQAVQAAEFTFTRFQSLVPLLLVHGRYAYYRISLFILYYFYKNFILVFTEMWFAFFSGYSGQIYFLDWLSALYNTFFTSWPCLAFCALDRDVSPENSLKYHRLYCAGQNSEYFNIKEFWKWVCFAAFSSAWIFWLPYFGCAQGVDDDGREVGLFWVSTSSFILLIFAVNLKLLLSSSFWNKISLLTILLSVFLFFCVALILNITTVAIVFQPEFNGLFLEILRNGKTWIIVLIGSILTLLIDLIYIFVKNIYFPSLSMKLICNLREKNK